MMDMAKAKSQINLMLATADEWALFVEYFTRVN